MSSENSENSPSEKISESGFVGTIYHKFITHVTSGQRSGQAWMNALSEVNMELYQQIHGTEADCFYNDQKIPAFKRVVFGKE